MEICAGRGRSGSGQKAGPTGGSPAFHGGGRSGLTTWGDRGFGMTREEGWRNFYGRRHGKALRPAQRRSLEEILPRVRVPGLAADGTRDGGAVELESLFPAAREVWLEIGFGGGEHLYRLARDRPQTGFIGCEPFVNGVAMLLGKMAEADPGNIRVHPGDARDLIDRLPQGVLGRVYLLYPDPWPKARHYKRRFVNPETLAPLALRMESGAELRLATDILDYAEHAVMAAAETGLLAPVVTAEPDWARPWSGWESTRYEAKALREGRRPHYLVWRRR
jgi:tRNA (guanine-N7-)-methyltransferase